MNENIIAGDKTAKPKYTYSLNSDDKNLIIGLVTDNSETVTGTADYYGITVNDLCKNDDGILFMLNDIVSDDFSAEVIGEMLVRIFSFSPRFKARIRCPASLLTGSSNS